MQTEARVIFRYDGLRAEIGRLGASDSEQNFSGVRRLLSAHAHCFVTGQVPANSVDRTKHYWVEREGAERGCVIDPWIVTFTAGVAAMIAGTYSIRVIDKFGPFLAQSILSCLENELPDVPYSERLEPTLHRIDGGNRQVFDFENEHRRQQELLKRTTTLSMLSVSRPIGRSASSLTIVCEGAPPIIINDVVVRRLESSREYYQEAITTFVKGQRLPNY